RDERPATAPADDAPASGRRGADRPVQGRGPVEEPPASGGKTAGMWIGLILGAIILVMLLIFVIQNNVTAGFQYFGTEFDLPLGVAMLLAAIAGALVMALVGSVRMIQMSWTIRKLRKQQEKVHRATR
ncbi:MAG: lipopolysaccharide assembly protein LapA domain-containing protein, partial [Brachybacterium sp.]|nr:lipopolysaccharide assembly protein LapA domain-containing protein [Brachybacterium sp.]